MDANFSVRKISRPPYLRSSAQQHSILTADFIMVLLVSQTPLHCLKPHREKVLGEEKFFLAARLLPEMFYVIICVTH